jgi:hypothetical protein
MESVGVLKQLFFRWCCRRTRHGFFAAHNGITAGAGTEAPVSQNRQRDGRQHENDGAPGRELGEQRGRSAGAKCRLAADAAERRGNVSTFAVLQQHNQNEHRAYDHVNDGNQPNKPHGLEKILSKILVRKGGFEPPRLTAPPPQDGVSASSTTSALARMTPPGRKICIQNN